MVQLNATYRLLVTADGEWWGTLTDDMKRMYVKEHPESKYAKEPIGNGTPSQPVNQMAPTGQGRGQGLVKAPVKRPSFGPKDEQTKKALKNLPPKVQKFVNKGGTQAGSKQRKEDSEKVRSASSTLARGILKDTVGVAKGLASIKHMVDGKPKPGDFKKAASFIGNILGASAMIALLGTTGPVGILTFMAVKHLAAPELYKITRKALAKKPPADAKDDYGYWEKGEWIPLSKKAWEEQFDELGPGTRKDMKKPKSLGPEANPAFAPKDVRSSVVTATEEEEQLKAVIDAIADYAASGDIDPDAWKAAIAEMNEDQEQQFGEVLDEEQEADQDEPD